MEEVKLKIEEASIEAEVIKYSRSTINPVLVASKESIRSSFQKPPRIKGILKAGHYQEQNGREAVHIKHTKSCSSTSSSFRNMLDLITLDEMEVDENGGVVDSVDLARHRYVMKRMRFITCVICVGGFLSGYSVGIIPGALLPVRSAFNLDRRQSDMLVSCMIISAFTSSFVGGVVNGYLGRRKAIMVAAAAFSLGCIVLFTAQDPSALFYGEIVTGTAIGIESMTSPLYIAEVVKPNVKSVTISMYTLMIMVGQVVAAITCGILGPRNWRYIFGLGLIPSLLLLTGFYTLPESPSWLMTRNQRLKAQTIYQTIRDLDDEVKHEMVQFENSLTQTGGGFDFVEKPLLTKFQQMIHHPPTRRALAVGCGLMLLQQFCGINAVIYFAAPIYQLYGFTESTSIWLSCMTVVSQIIGQFINITIVEKVKRRTLVLSSLILVAISTTGLGISFYIARQTSSPIDMKYSIEQCEYQPKWLPWETATTTNCLDCVQIDGCGYCGGACVTGNVYSPTIPWMCPLPSKKNHYKSIDFSYYSCENPYKWLPVTFINLFVFVFGLGMASVPWIVNTELFPPQHCSLAVGLSTAANWMGNLIVSSTFLELSDPTKLTTYGTFFLYSMISFLGVIWIHFALPETIDSSFIDSEDFFKREYDSKDDITLEDSETSLLNKKQKVTFSAYDTIVSKDSLVHQSPQTSFRK